MRDLGDRQPEGRRGQDHHARCASRAAWPTPAIACCWSTSIRTRSLTRAFGVPTDPPPARHATSCSTSHAHRCRGLARDIAGRSPALSPRSRRWRRWSVAAPPSPASASRSVARCRPQRDGYDYALLDCPPTLGLLMVNALAACDRLIVAHPDRPARAARPAPTCCAPRTMVERSRAARCCGDPARPCSTSARARASRAWSSCARPTARSVCPDPIPVDTRLRDADALGSREHMYGRGLAAYEHAMQWLLDTAPAGQEAA